jgi:thioredoxin reductase (NADPH)
VLDNYPGFPQGVSGEEFATRLQQQAERFGVEILQAQEVTGFDVDGPYRHVRTSDGCEYSSHALLLALGSTYRTLGIPGETDFTGAGVHFCATCDGPFYRDDEVLVIGGGDSAAEESLFLARFASKVTIATRGEGIKASKVILEKIEREPAIEILPGVEAVAFEGRSRLESVTLRERESGAERDLQPAGVFVFVGMEPNTEAARGVIDLDDLGFVLTDLAMETSAPGVFAAGDCRANSTKQAASAAGEGATAALSMREYVEPHRGKQPSWLAATPPS